MRNSRNDERSPLKMAILMVGGLVGAERTISQEGARDNKGSIWLFSGVVRGSGDGQVFEPSGKWDIPPLWTMPSS
jgi:hypothetical protein